VPRATTLLPLLWVLLTLPASAGPLPLTVDGARSSVVAIAEVAGVLGFLGHPHAILATEVSVELVYDEETPSRSRVEVRVPTRALRIDSREAIAAGRLRSRPDPETVEKLQTKMLSPRMLDAERHPTIEFTSTGVEQGDGRVRIRGVFRMHGRAREIEIPVRVARLPSSVFRFSGEFDVRQTDFGIQPESIAGVVKVADPVTIQFDVIARAPDAHGAR